MGDFPTADAGEDHTFIDTKKVEQRLKALVQDLERYTLAENYDGTPNSITADLNRISEDTVGAGKDNGNGYPGGRYVYATIQNVQGTSKDSEHKGLPAEYQAWLQNYVAVVRQLYSLAQIQINSDVESVLSNSLFQGGA